MSNLPAIFFEPDGYVLDGPKLMGRQSAGNGFLRAAVQAVEAYAATSGQNELLGYTPRKSSAEVFAHVVAQLSNTVKPVWLPANRQDLLTRNGALFIPGPGLGEAARRRLRAGIGAWSLTGTTYTLCSHNAMDAIVDIINAPVMPWDALICATSVARQSVQTLFELQAKYFSWRFGVNNFVIPELPIIPFGVHQSDFNFTPQDRHDARKNLEISDEEIVILFAGRLSFHAKAHPYPMFKALEHSASVTGKKITLILCGQFPNEPVKMAFLNGVKTYAPNVSVKWINGKEPEAYNRAWAGADIFISLSDNIQETFGITPVEAMAAGLPVIVTDWDGYKDTIIEGETGFRIPTWMPPAGLGAGLASAYETSSISYDEYIGYAALNVALDNQALVARLCDLISNQDLRRQMGEKGKARVATHYDWTVVMRQHQELWSELKKKRLKMQFENQDLIKSAPNCAAARQDPYKIFASFPTQIVSAENEVSLGHKNWREQDWRELLNDPLFNFGAVILPTHEIVTQIMGSIALAPNSKISIKDLARNIDVDENEAIKIVTQIAKIGLLDLVAKV